MKRYCLAVDLKNDPQLISEYEAYHKDIWPAIRESIIGAGITVMDIYRVEERLFMIMETDDDFTFERKKQMDEDNPVVQQWETMLWKFQQAIPGAAPGEKWRLMDQIFTLNKS